MEVINIKDLSFRYPDTESYALNNLSISIDEGDFVVICGPTGCGKSTLLRLLKKEIAPHGHLTGEISYFNKPIDKWDERKLIEDIGFIFQDPDNQIVLDNVLQEMVFGLENLGHSNVDMRKRIAELTHTFGYEQLLHEKPSELSGGQKQILNLLSVLALKPRVLLLDEPTSQLDPIIAKDLLVILDRLNKELGMTIVLVEHRLEELFDIADKVVMMDKGEIAYYGTSREVINQVFQRQDRRYIPFLPAVSSLYLNMASKFIANEIPLNVKEARTWLASLSMESSGETKKIKNRAEQATNPIIELKDVFFQFDKDKPMVLKNLSLTVQQGEFYGIIGGNGSGKTTLLKVGLNILKPQLGKVKVFGQKYNKKTERQLYRKMEYLPQNPLSYFTRDSIEEELIAIAKKHKLNNMKEIVAKQLHEFGIEHIKSRHPNDCSGGEMQKAALACMLLENPEVLWVDEPTKGLDPISKRQLATILKKINQKGVTIVMVTHDIEFAAKYTTTCAMMFDGQITTEASPEQLFKGNYFYTTTINRTTQNSPIDEALTLEEVLTLWEKSKASSY